MTQAKLEALARWVEGLPAYQLTYPDLEVAMTQVQRLLQRPAEALAS